MITKKDLLEKKGFTLLEMMIVLTLVGILLSTVFAIIFVVLRQQARIYRILETRRQGDAIFNFMKERIVRSTSIEDGAGTPVCVGPAFPSSYSSATGDNFLLTDSGTRYKFRLPATTNILLFNDVATGLDTPLHSDRVIVSNFTITCQKNSSTSTPIIQFAYTVRFNDATPTAQEGNQVLNYRSKVKLR